MESIYEIQLKRERARQHFAGPIQAPEQLPVPGEARESQSLDFKRLPSDRKSRAKATEHAKDMAAMANARGGTILVGAIENDEVLVSYSPFDVRTATEVIDAYENAARSFCSPPPIIVCTQIPVDSGFVVAVHVLPHPGNFMGVRIPVKKNELYSGGAAYRFPVRVGSQTAEVEPAAFPVPEVRKVMLALARIAPGASVQLCYQNDNPGGRVEPIHTFVRLDIVEQMFTTSDSGGASRQTPVEDVRVVVPAIQGTKRKPISSPWRIRMKPDARW